MKVFYTIHYWKVSNMKRVLLYSISIHSNSGNIHLYGLSINDTIHLLWLKENFSPKVFDQLLPVYKNPYRLRNWNQLRPGSHHLLSWCPFQHGLGHASFRKDNQDSRAWPQTNFLPIMRAPSWLQSIKEQFTLASWWTGALSHPRL